MMMTGLSDAHQRQYNTFEYGEKIMMHEKQEHVFSELKGDDLQLYICVTNECLDDEDVKIIDSLVNSDELVEVKYTFTLPSILDTHIKMAQLEVITEDGMHPTGKIDAIAKDQFIAMRKELADMISRIDALEYE